jgi:hypothetical protein
VIERDLGDGVDAVENALPVRVQIAGTRKEAGHADDGHARRALGRLRGAHLLLQRLEQARATRADVIVLLRHADHLVSQAGGLTDHVHAAAELVLVPDVDESRGTRALALRPIDALGGDTQPADVERFQRLADLVRIAALSLEAAILLLERLGIRGRNAADSVAGAGFEQNGVLTAKCLLLISRHDSTRGDRFLREQVRRADQDSDSDAALHQRGRDRGHHCRG